jgi:2Fe-2S ferredoxin
MPSPQITVTFVEHNGTQHTIAADIDQSLMQAAMNAGIPGIPADCGGACACATCHTIVDDAWVNAFPPAEELEQNLLECASGVTPNSRLSCQLLLTEQMHGLRVSLPESPY